jgi:hypothetical protein
VSAVDDEQLPHFLLWKKLENRNVFWARGWIASSLRCTALLAMTVQAQLTCARVTYFEHPRGFRAQAGLWTSERVRPSF